MTTTNDSATQATPKPADVLGQQREELFNVVALLHAVEERVDDLYLEASMETKLHAHQTLRLAQMARAKVEASIRALA